MVIVEGEELAVELRGLDEGLPGRGLAFVEREEAGCAACRSSGQCPGTIPVSDNASGWFKRSRVNHVPERGASAAPRRRPGRWARPRPADRGGCPRVVRGPAARRREGEIGAVAFFFVVRIDPAIAVVVPSLEAPDLSAELVAGELLREAFGDFEDDGLPGLLGEVP